jgi:glycosyltransferase involved in cell wall biosynthesis
MRIAQLAPLFEPVPPRLYGGTERVVSWLTEELVRRGHDVTLFASGDSQTAAQLVAPYPRGLRLDPDRPDPVAMHMVELGQALERARDFDIMHCHVDYLALAFNALVPTPMVHTLHGRLDLPHLPAVFAQFASAPLVSISNGQRIPVARLGLNWVATVYHGLPVERVPFCAAPRGDYLLFLGRTSREKRPDLAIAVAQRAGMKLKIAAKIDETDPAYFEEVVRPHLHDPLIEFVGEVGDEEKWRLLCDAVGLLFPIDWPEPFGITMIEALACGTPVVARPCGAVPEIIRDGEVGYVADTVEELVTAVKRVEDMIDRATCRRHVETHFSVRAMADGYEAVYRRLAR